MGYKKKRTECESRHPERDVQCWGNHLDKWHWAYVPAAHGRTVKVTWE